MADDFLWGHIVKVQLNKFLVEFLSALSGLLISARKT
jgi:hypothetical protein